MEQYLNVVRQVINEGQLVSTRNGRRLTTYRHSMTFDLDKGFPMVTTARKNFWNIAGELCWFLNGDKDIKRLHGWNIHIWDANADDDGNVGLAYGFQWRNWQGHLDQIQHSITMAIKNPSSTRNLVTAWNPADLDRVALPPCHYSFQVHTPPDWTISLQVTMRSTDVMVGLPYNISSYATLLHLYAIVTGRRPKYLYIDLSNIHIYEEHIPNALIQLKREPLPLPSFYVVGTIPSDLKGIEPGQLQLKDYEAHPYLKYEMKA